MRPGILIALSIFALAFCAAASAQGSHWKEGVVSSMEKTHELQGTTTTRNTQGTAKDNGNNKTTYNQNSTTTQNANYDDFMVYVIEGGGKVYTAKQRLTFPWTKSANLTVGDNVKYHVEKGKIVFLDDDKKEFAIKIVKTTLKSAE
jgi:hypothetical protein